MEIHAIDCQLLFYCEFRMTVYRVYRKCLAFMFEVVTQFADHYNARLHGNDRALSFQVNDRSAHNPAILRMQIIVRNSVFV